ncbi:DUF302 domain-containing protein [Streptosporangium lutulentum]|uniref:Uncharacterized protein (DUF302 family) n=1 Tax=Streptosporangium lutulentum TaxID=1461250 RepID=A0ABT9QF80_9ACTN|nr:DUF302 domain-containing protein [Streptosporangium lutulentum]MDP9844599.1 uncharacterized protein (DUF302 family) [Streptosporangium lutulentum]
MEIITHDSAGSVAETLERLKGLITAKGLNLFTVIEHDVAAAAAGLSMRPTKVVIFGSPAAGTPLMIAVPLLALDLPLKILIWQDASGRTRVSHDDVDALQKRHGLTDEQAAPLRGVGILAAAAAGA